MTDTVLGQLAALKTAPILGLKQKWRELFDTEPPPYNRRFLEHRLAYRIQELAYGGLDEETVERLDALADELEGKAPKRRNSLGMRPIAGTRLGGWAPLGYDIKNRKLIVNESEADLVRSIFARFARGIPPQQLIEAIANEGSLNKQGKPIEKGYLYRVLHNRVYLGEAVHMAGNPTFMGVS